MEEVHQGHSLLPMDRGNGPEQPLRRHFLVQGALGAVAVAVGLSTVSATPIVPKWAMVIDLNRCTGCQACVIACKALNDTAPKQFNTQVIVSEGRNAQGPRSLFTPIQCNHCDQPPCVEACSENATFKLANGIVVTDWNRCTGKQSCVTACPYGARHADPRHGQKVDKCDFCLHLLEKGLQPACVTACGPGARLFGDTNNPQGEFADYWQRSDLVPPKPEQKLTTAVRYILRRDNAGKGGHYEITTR